jgi:hypothetical protein
MTIDITGQLQIDVEDASLRRTERRLEDALSDIQVGGSGVSGSLDRDVNGGGGVNTATSIQAEQLEQLEEINDTLERMALSGGGGGGGGLLPTSAVTAGTSGGSILSLLTAGTVAAGIGGPAAVLAGLREDPNPNATRTRVRTPVGPGTVTTPGEITVDAPSWLEDPMLQTPSWLNGPIGVEVPQILQNLPSIDISVPPALQGLLGGGGGGGATQSTLPSNVPPASAYVNNRGNEQFRQRGAIDINLQVEHELRNASREFERAIEDAVRDSTALQRAAQQALRDSFDGFGR